MVISIMERYLTEFFRDQGYEPADAAYLLDIYGRVSGDPRAKTLWDEAMALYDGDAGCSYDEIIHRADRVAELLDFHHYTAELLVFICLSRRLRERYAERGLDMDIFARSMADLRYKLEECKLVYGIRGSFVAGWFTGFFNLTRFGLGRLQFELIPFGAEYEKDGHTLTADSTVVNVHIPRSGEPLTEEACMDAYLRAKALFGDRVADPCPFVCSSWLLYPEHEQFLPHHTNTYRFYKSFDIFASGYTKNRSNLWRLFDTMECNPDKLPADTSLRRAYVTHLKNGGQTGWGRGVLFV